jgi:[acyl-carrier-protein] S-malonyltransferase
MPLNVSGPFHSALMKAAGEGLREFLRGVTFSAPRAHFVSSVSGREERDPHVIRELLWKQVFSPVRWTDVMHTLGPEDALELGPGNVLQGLAKRMEGAPIVRPAGTLEQVTSLVKIG